MLADGLYAARRATAGVFFGLLVGLLLSWAGLTVMAVTSPRHVASARAACPSPSPGSRPGQPRGGPFAGDCRRVRPPARPPGGQLPGRPLPGRPQPPSGGSPR